MKLRLTFEAGGGGGFSCVCLFVFFVCTGLGRAGLRIAKSVLSLLGELGASLVFGASVFYAAGSSNPFVHFALGQDGALKAPSK